MTLHACPGYIVIQDMSIVEVSLYFSICLSKDFTTQIGGYIASNWSYMFFRTRYQTKSSIRVEHLSLNHMEMYTPSPININCTIFDEGEEYTSHKHTTPLVEVPDYILDE